MLKTTALVVLALIAAPLLAFAAEPSSEIGGKRALLVGCTKYDNLETRWELGGPTNDVALLRSVLIDKFGFPAANITSLTEAAGGDELRPTLANIQREFATLIASARPGDQVVILLSGHGSQQPDTSNDARLDPEPDGLDEVFLPADVASWGEAEQAIGNGLIDDQLGAWLRAIRAKGALVWIIFDACHSGTMIRGNDVEKQRRVPPDVLVPRAVLDRARERSSSRSRGAAAAPSESVFGELGSDAGFVALYAVRPDETTPERPLPIETAAGVESKTHGLLTFALCEVLTEQQSPLVYRDLAERIFARYVSWGLSFPVPLAEGTDLDREVLGVREWPRSPIVLDALPQGRCQINVGSLYGLTLGSVLEVRPPAGAANADQLLGHVKVKRLTMLDADVVPCEFGNQPTPDKLPPGALCEVAYLDGGSLRLRVAVDQRDDAGKSVSAGDVELLGAELAKLVAKSNPFIEITPDSASAHWLVRRERGKTYLVSAAGISQRDVKDGSLPADAAGESGARFGPAPADQPLDGWLSATLTRVARAQNLLRLTDPSPAAASIEISMLRYRDLESPKYERVERGSEGLTLRSGEVIAFEIRNPNSFPVDATLLFVDSGYGIEAYWPEPGTVLNNRILPGKSVITPRGEINAKTIGIEHMLVLAVQTGPRPVDFTCLAQPSLDRARGTQGTRGSGDDALATPLGQFLAVASYTNDNGPGKSRGLTRRLTEQCMLRRLSWEVSPDAATNSKTESPDN